MPHELLTKLSMLVENSGPKQNLRLGILQILVAAWQINADVSLTITTQAEHNNPWHDESPTKPGYFTSDDESAGDIRSFTVEGNAEPANQRKDGVLNEIDPENQVSQAVKGEDHFTDDAVEVSEESTGSLASGNVNSDLPDMKASAVSMSKEASTACTVCRKVCKTARNLRMHMRVHKSELPTQGSVQLSSVSCHVCFKVFINETKLSEHLRMHERVRKRRLNVHYECDVCQEVFHRRMDLQDHKDSHAKKKKIFQCKHCGETLGCSSQLILHMRKHMDEQHKQCLVCQKKFKSVDYMKQHMNLHTRGGPFECSECGQACSGPNSLIIHKQVHTGAMPFQCCHCGQVFSTKGNMMAHMKRLH